MTRHILDMIQEQQMVRPPEPTERSQIGIMSGHGYHNIVRFSTLKKGEKEYKALKAAWSKYRNSGRSNGALHDIAGDMHITTVDLDAIVAISFVDIAKRVKFIPFAG